MASRELILLREQTAQARADLAGLEQDIVTSTGARSDQLQMDYLIEANQQLVLAMLSMQAKPVKRAAVGAADQSRDIRKANEQLVISALKAQNLQAKAESGFAHQKTALATVAHELRNPLTPISLLAGRLVSVPSAELPGMQAMIQEQVKHMARLIEDLLDVSRATTGKMRLERADVDIVSILASAVDTCQALMHSKGLHFTALIPESPLRVHGDAVRLAQVLHNLLTNAAKYTPSGGTVELTAAASAGSLRISVRDDGIGISNELLFKIFEAYVQDIRAVAFNGTGLGIGLTVVRELVEAHGGSVTCKSEGEGKGSEFTVVLPLS